MTRYEIAARFLAGESMASIAHRIGTADAYAKVNRAIRGFPKWSKRNQERVIAHATRIEVVNVEPVPDPWNLDLLQYGRYTV